MANIGLQRVLEWIILRFYIQCMEQDNEALYLIWIWTTVVNDNLRKFLIREISIQQLIYKAYDHSSLVKMETSVI